METNFDHIELENTLKNEKKVKGVANTTLVTGLIASAVLIIVGFAQYNDSYMYGEPVNWMLVLTGFFLSLLSLITWGILWMLSEISTTLKNK